jgi:hypothetical protein
MSTATGYGAPRDARQVPLTPGQRLAQDAAAAAELRAYQTDPDVVALRVERIRNQVDRLMWAGIVLGLCFTMTNVQQFAAAGAAVGSLAWCSAWLLDPMVSLVLLAVLRAEQVTTRYQVATGPWPRVAKWALLSATYVMNTWMSWAAGTASGVVLHSVAPLVVVIAAEAVTDLQYALSECVHRAHTTATERTERAAPAERADRAAVTTGTPGHPALADTGGEHPAGGIGGHRPGGVGERFAGAAGERGQTLPVSPTAAVAGRAARRVGGHRHTPGKRSAGPVRRKLLADYLGEAHAAWTPGLVVTPAWVRQVTDCSRGLSSKVAAALNAELPTARHSSARTEPERRAA